MLVRLIAAASLGASGAWLVVVSWQRASILGLLCGALGSVAAIVATTSAGAGGANELLAGSLAAIVIGTVLLVLGQTIQRLLEEEPEDSR
jgi:Kef-type K+ transport system membrane component KefB